MGLKLTLLCDPVDYAYDALGRQVAVIDPLGHTVTTTYDAEGRVTSQRGATYPVDYAYDAYGNKVAMTTYRDEELVDGDTTRWLYDEPSGCMTNKVYADGKGPSYDYTPDGKLARRDRAAMSETSVVEVPGSEIPETAVSVCGLVVTNVTSTGIATVYGYDALGRETSATDGRGNTATTAYDAQGRVASTTDGAGNATVYGYDALGRRVSATDPMGNTVTTAYDAEGRVVAQRGATYPVDYAYNDYGEKISMTTYRDEPPATGDTTRWLRDEATGLVTNKVYADGNGPRYSYTVDGKLATRTWARGVVTAYAYDSSGALTNTVYSDGTPTVSMAYDRTGNLVSAITAGVCTNLYAYDTTGLCTNEVQNGVAIARSYDALGRPTGYIVGGQTVSYAYDPVTGRLISVASGTNEFFYTYLPGTDLVAGYVSGDFSHTVSYEISRNLVSAVTNRFGSRVISAFGYSNDAAGRRTAISRSGEAFGDLSGSTDSYGYNLRSEVVSARRTKGGASVRGFDEDFSYDPIGNRVATTNYDETGSAIVSEYSANSLNQYTSRTVPGVAAVRGFADANATVTVNENPTWRLGEYFFGSDEFDNTTAAVDAALVTTAALASPTNGPDEVASVTSRVHIARTPQTFEYDDDGNQTLVTTKTGTWRVTYNGENRPVRWTRINAADTNDQTTVLMSFDHQGRRRMYLEVNANGTTNHLDCFTYDNYLCVARNRWQPDGTSATDRFVWDPTEPIATRPLVFYQPNAPPMLYAIDGNKNISELVASDDGSISAHYEYAPFGEVILTSGRLVLTNPYRFSSEYADDTLALAYYNYRHLDPETGRWLRRDSVDEAGGINLYFFCLNRLEGDVDVSGCAYFALRPLRGLWWLPIMSHNPLDDYLNTEISHEQLFFEDGLSPSNVGYFDDSTVKSSEDPRDGYRVTRTGYNDCVMRMAVAEVQPKPYSLLGWGKGVQKYNCQDYAEDLRDAYNRLTNLKNVREKCCLK